MRPRIVYMADVFDCPAELQAGWNSLQSKIELGHDLLPHLSRQIRQIEAVDRMLFHWGINHFHLGIKPDQRYAEMVQGGSDIVYASIMDEKFYALNIGPHGKWTDEELVKTLRRCWPGHPNFGNKMSLSVPYTNDQAWKLRAAQINVPTILEDGVIFMPGGQMTDGASWTGTSNAMVFRRCVAQVGTDVVAALGQSTSSDPSGAIALVADEDWCLQISHPKHGSPISLLNPVSGERLKVGEIVESWRS